MNYALSNSMKLRFDANLHYQEQAVAAVVDLFRGQQPRQNVFSPCNFTDCGTISTDHGIGNLLELDEQAVLSNLRAVQLRNGLPQTRALQKGAYDFDIEMETGTGKTYVYLRTIFALNQAYGFKKFIIVVPSIAIKEGVSRTLEITREHFQNLYNNVVYDCYIYDGSKPEEVRSFAVNDNVSIMVLNIAAFRKSFDDPDKENKANIIHRASDRLDGMRPITLIQQTNPVVIVDEPQSVEGRGASASRRAMASLNALCTLRYSATHVDRHNLIYKLDAVDAFALELVKQIEVASFESLNCHNKAYMKLLSVNNKKSPITARLELDCESRGTIRRKAVTVRQGDDLSEKLSGYRDVYRGYIVDDICCVPGDEYVSFTTKPEILRIGEAVGDIDDRAVKEQQIRKTIEEHLNKELVLNPQGIKVLSLFFIDKVSNYRYYDAQGVRHNGIYADMFEKHYRELIRRPKYRSLFPDTDLDALPREVHGGYFSGDKKGRNSDREWKDTSGTAAVDESAYNLIMRDKETLLSFDSKLRFIFSHTALREGWDNPNVFQICTLNETKSEVKKRQELGRGLRLCVNQEGERQHGFSVNTLTVMANESYEQFASSLQREYEEDEGIRFGILEPHSFSNIPVRQQDGSPGYLGGEESARLYRMMQTLGYLDAVGRLTQPLREALKTGTLTLPEEWAACQTAIAAICTKAAGGLKIRPAREKRAVGLNNRRFEGEDFRALWNRIKYKTTYQVDFDSQQLVERCAGRMRQALEVSAGKLMYTKAKVRVWEDGVGAAESQRLSVLTTSGREPLPDIVTYLQNRTGLTRKTIVMILTRSGTLGLFEKNPQAYMAQAANIIGAAARLSVVDGLRYRKLGGSACYDQALFRSQAVTGYLGHNMLESHRSVYDYVVYDSEVECQFAQNLEHCENVKVYVKLPDWFRIPTPLGSYTPDWAVVVENDRHHKFYCVIETKGSASDEDLRPVEYSKFRCGEKHFAALGTDIQLMKVDSFRKFVERIL